MEKWKIIEGGYQKGIFKIIEVESYRRGIIIEGGFGCGWDSAFCGLAPLP